MSNLYHLSQRIVVGRGWVPGDVAAIWRAVIEAHIEDGLEV